MGLNSGEVIAGEVGSGPASYTAVGAQVGMAQRMESIAPPGGVMLSESTARLVEHLKKGDMAKEAQRLLEGTGWLPQRLRAPMSIDASVSRTGDASDASSLPSFLTEGMTSSSDAPCIAAE